MGYGADSECPNGANPCGTAFYIGKLGEGGTTGGFNNWNSTVASNSSRVTGYWYLTGPNDPDKGSRTAYQWGNYQASLAYSAWQNKTGINSGPVFCDVETYNGYWSSTLADNRSVIQGFADYFAGPSSPVSAGVYSSQGEWNTITGNVAPSSFGFSWLWGAGPLPGNTCPSTYAPNTIGGETPHIWQFSQVDTDRNMSNVW